MSVRGKITTISCRIDLRAIEPLSNSLISDHRTERLYVLYCAHSISLILAITRSGLLV